MEWGEIFTRGLALLAAGCYLARALIDLVGSHSPRTDRWNRGMWSLGCAALWLHIAAAFHFIHDWSHADAVRLTAEQTRQLTGWAWGGGVYINYAFAIFWLMDVLRWWSRNDFPSAAWFWTTHALFGFMMFNATVVFGPAYWRYVALAFAGLCFGIWWKNRQQPSDQI